MHTKRKFKMKSTTILLTAISTMLLVGCESTDANTDSVVLDAATENSAEASPEIKLDNLKFNARTTGGKKLENQVEIDKSLADLEQGQHKMAGYWVGDFGIEKDEFVPNKINIIISNAKDGKVTGHTVCAGNFRPFTGTYEEINEDEVKLKFEEPGDDKYDGAFEVTLSNAKNEMSGSWKPFKSSTSDKIFTLKKVDYSYTTNNGDYPEGSEVILEEKDVENLNPVDLEQMRNEIYARHGYSFKNKDMRRHFDDQDWYVPMCVDVRDKLTDIEVANIDMILRYEEYYEEFMEEFGR